MFYEAWTESLRLSINPFCLKWRGRRDWRSVWLWKQPFILLNGALVQPWRVFSRVPCQGNSILATVETIPCRLPFSSHTAPLCFCLTHKCTSQEKTCEWLRSPCLRKPGAFLPHSSGCDSSENLLWITGWVRCTKRAFGQSKAEMCIFTDQH